jgi:hypothetical protein
VCYGHVGRLYMIDCIDSVRCRARLLFRTRREVLKLRIEDLQRTKEALSALNSDRKPFRMYEYEYCNF